MFAVYVLAQGSTVQDAVAPKQKMFVVCAVVPEQTLVAVAELQPKVAMEFAEAATLLTRVAFVVGQDAVPVAVVQI